MKRRLKGSQTVEAALVFPLVIFLVVSIMYFVFYIHDRVVMDSCAYYSALMGVFSDESGHEVAKENVRELNLLVVTPTSTWTEGTREVNIKYKGKFTTPFVAMQPFMSNESIDENSDAYRKMKIENMYVIKVVKDMWMKEG